jgi:hypothetical protein
MIALKRKEATIVGKFCLVQRLTQLWTFEHNRHFCCKLLHFIRNFFHTMFASANHKREYFGFFREKTRWRGIGTLWICRYVEQSLKSHGDRLDGFPENRSNGLTKNYASSFVSRIVHQLRNCATERDLTCNRDFSYKQFGVATVK